MAKTGIVLGAVAIMAATAAAPASAQSINAPPVMVDNTTPVDPSKLPMTDDGKKAVTDVTAQLKAGSLLGAVFTGSLDLRLWAGSYAYAGLPQSTTDLARQALERCEFLAKGPCTVLSANGHEARSPDGSWPAQPRMLKDEPGGRIDPFTIPFVPLAYRPAIANYASLVGPKALVLTTAGAYFWSSGKKIFEAVDAAQAACAKQNDPATCVLYAVNDTVVMAP